MCSDPEGCLGTRSDDTKSLKSVIIDWILPVDQSSVLHSHGMSKLHAASTTIALVFYFARLALIGLMLSEVIVSFELSTEPDTPQNTGESLER
jgi:hypothetical protein